MVICISLNNKSFPLYGTMNRIIHSEKAKHNFFHYLITDREACSVMHE